MAKPIYANSYSNRGGGRWKRVFVVIVLLHIVALGVYFYLTKGKKDEKTAAPLPAPAPAAGLPAAGLPAPAPSASLDLAPAPAPIAAVAATPQSRAIVSDAQAAIDAGQLDQAKTMLDQLVQSTPDPDAVKLLGQVNMQLLKSPRMMPGKEYYTIASGDYLQKIAKKYNVTVPLIQAMNGMENDNSRLGARLLVYNGDFSIRVSKTRNTLDLMAGEKLFKRYAVGTGKFGKTPAVEFKIVDKIIEPPWTRFSDGKQIEYGDPENVLGTRWMAIKSDEHPEITGFGIHGTWERDSIGKQSSAGCIRMLNEDVEELFDIVPRQTTVIITE